MGIADDIAGKMKGPGKVDPKEEAAESKDEKDAEGAAEGRAVLAAIKSGDAAAVYEAIKACT